MAKCVKNETGINIFNQLSVNVPCKIKMVRKLIILESVYIMLPLIVATLAPIINCIQPFPQLYKTYITKSVKDLSVWSLVLILTTNLLWLLHGYFIVDIPLIVTGVINMIVNITLLTLYFFYRKVGGRSSQKEKM
jgi:MtN3 and saliva related transmembrane protein